MTTSLLPPTLAGRRDDFPRCPASSEAHPVADIFPMMSDAELLDLVEDVRSHGLREPIWLHRDGRIIDGRNRAIACQQLGIEPEARVFEGDDSELVAFVLSLNLHRRHLTESQRAMIAARVANLKPGRPSETPSIDGVSAESAATMLNVSTSSVERAKKVQDRGAPELVAAVDAGEVAVSAAASVAEIVKDRVASLPPAEVRQVVAEAVEEKRQEDAKRRADREALDSLARELDLPKVDEKAEDERIALTQPLYRAIQTLANMPAPADVVDLIPAYQDRRMDDLPAAHAWLDEFVHLWKARS
ncbi:MAG TPA: ParB/RepB/Spo0J family partition protein [Rugosimonospora sp.]|nr:ParB/RepB/Spo0J family partition protein [Rugosimonospora sp.]